jgi:hypothetical protein
MFCLDPQGQNCEGANCPILGGLDDCGVEPGLIPVQIDQLCHLQAVFTRATRQLFKGLTRRSETYVDAARKDGIVTILTKGSQNVLIGLPFLA